MGDVKPAANQEWMLGRGCTCGCTLTAGTLVKVISAYDERVVVVAPHGEENNISINSMSWEGASFVRWLPGFAPAHPKEVPPEGWAVGQRRRWRSIASQREREYVVLRPHSYIASWWWAHDPADPVVHFAVHEGTRSTLLPSPAAEPAKKAKCPHGRMHPMSCATCTGPATEPEAPRMEETAEDKYGQPVECLQCGAKLSEREAFECGACPSLGYSDRRQAWLDGQRRFPRKPQTPAQPPKSQPSASQGAQANASSLGRDTAGPSGARVAPAPAAIENRGSNSLAAGAGRPAGFEVSSDGRHYTPYDSLTDADPLDSYRFRRRIGDSQPIAMCLGALAQERATQAGRAWAQHAHADAHMSERMDREGKNKKRRLAAPEPWRCGVTDEDLLPDVDAR